MAALFPLLVGLVAPGCYYGHLASGQLQILFARKPIGSVVEDPETPPQVRHQLRLVEATRQFATQLDLEVGEQYTSYVDWPGDRIVTTVVAARPGEVEPAGFDFLIVGHVPYKGFFDLDAAEAEAADLRAEGLDVCVIPVTAYSTLGWMDDPVTTPMLRRGDSALVETVIHELVHATVFVESQPEFNEGVARFIGQEGAVRFYAAAGDATEAEATRTRVEEDRLIARLTLAFKDDVAALYASEAAATARAAREQDLRVALAALPLETRDPVALGERSQLNDACLAVRGTYATDIPLHEAILEDLGGSLPAFVARLREAAQTEDPRAAFFGRSPGDGAG